MQLFNLHHQSFSDMKSLLLLHGAIGAQDQFHSIVGPLSDGFDVHVLNFSGHGGAPFENGFGIAQFASDVLAYLNLKSINRTDIFGYSMGGYVALYLARHYPERIGRIFTLATKFEWTPEVAARETKMLDPALIAQKIPAFASVLEKRHAPQDWKQLLERTANMMVGLGQTNALSSSDYAQIIHPVRLALGDRDTMVTIGETLDVFRQLPDASLSIWPDTPHPIEKVNPERLTREIKDYFH